MFERPMVKAIIRNILKELPERMAEPKTETQSSHMPEYGTCDVPPLNQPIPKQPVLSELEDIPDTLDHPPLHQMAMRKNPETKAFEVYSAGVRDAERAVEQLNDAQQEAAATCSLITDISTPDETFDEEPEMNTKEDVHIMEMTYKDVTNTILYEPRTKKVLMQKGELIAREETNSLRKSKSHGGVRSKRRTILRKQSKPFSKEYNILTEDVEFSSLSQACCAIAGTIMNPSQYWKNV